MKVRLLLLLLTVLENSREPGAALLGIIGPDLDTETVWQEVVRDLTVVSVLRFF